MPRKSLVLFLVVVVAGALGVSRAFSQEPYEKEYQTLKKIIEHVQEDYVTEVDTKKLFEGAYRGALQALNDPFTQYFNQPEAKRFEAETEGKFGGLGIEISLKDGILTVITPIKGTPAYDAGILAGDQILKIDGKSTERLNLEDAVETLRGKVGTQSHADGAPHRRAGRHRNHPHARGNQAPLGRGRHARPEERHRLHPDQPVHRDGATTTCWPPSAISRSRG